jgi:hypothetical protein
MRTRVNKTIPRRKFVLRPYRRISTWYSAYYMSGQAIGKGVVKNLSRTGLRLLGDHSLTLGTEVSLRLSVDETTPPLEIARASVRWTSEYELGFRIEHLSADASHRLADLIAAAVSLRSDKAR